MAQERGATDISATDGLVAHWDFGRTDWRRPVRGATDLVLDDGPGSAARPGDHRGRRMLLLDGKRDFLVIPADAVGALDVGRHTGEVTVLAWVVRTGPRLGFVAGMWQEDDDDPRRQYGLFVDLGLYGGAHRVAGHVSRHGGPSPGLPYSRDACASARLVQFGQRHLIGFTFDGTHATAYLDGIADSRPDWTEPAPPYGFAERYPKNPFAFPDGLNRDVVSDFTIGAVRLRSGMGNFFTGGIESVMIHDRALTPEEMLDLAIAGRDPADPLVRAGFWRPTDVLDHRPDARTLDVWPPGQHGWSVIDPVDGTAVREIDAELVGGPAPTTGVRRRDDGCWLGTDLDVAQLVAFPVPSTAPLTLRFRVRRAEHRSRVVPAVWHAGQWWQPTCNWTVGGTGEVDLGPISTVKHGWAPPDSWTPADMSPWRGPHAPDTAVGFHLLPGPEPAEVGGVELW